LRNIQSADGFAGLTVAREAVQKMRSYLDLAIFLILCFALAGGVLQGQDRSQMRSMVVSRTGIVAAESPLAAQAGVKILEHGGNAVDAAIATNAMMGVVEPMMNGIGGDLFAIVYDRKANKLYGLNASGWAPRGLTIEFLRKQGMRAMPQQGVNSITVPGVVDGWQKLADRFGRKKLAEDLAAAIRTAREGFPVPEWTAAYWEAQADYLRSDQAATQIYLPEDRAPKLGEIFRNPDLAWSLEQVAQKGRDGFYQGELAAKIVEVIQKHGGTMTLPDLSEYSSEFVDPISTKYREWRIYELPPNGQGLAALEMLNIMETLPLGQNDWGFGSTKALHAMIEAKKLAYADLAKYIGEPLGANLPVTTLLSKPWAAQRAELIHADAANCEAEAGKMPAGSDTTYLSVVDREGNMVSLIQSNYRSFGSGVVAPGTGFALHDRGG
jgi:gamma-glutamyltranspeptidase / glutathione hydrolase